MTPADARRFGVNPGDHVLVKVCGQGRELIFGDVVVRVSHNYVLEMHLDTDEANAGELFSDSWGQLVRLEQ